MTTLLFIHGFATGPDIWRRELKEFSKDFKVTTDIDQVDRSDDVFVIGWSMGGWRALELWEEQYLKIKGIILVSAFAKYVADDDYPCGTSPALLRKLERKIKSDYINGLRYFYSIVFGNDKQDYFIKHLPIPDQNDIKQWFEKLRQHDLRSLLPKIDVPVLLIHGDRDEIVLPAASQYMYKKIPNSEIHILKGVGHAPFIDKEEEFSASLKDFIRRNAQ